MQPIARSIARPGGCCQFANKAYRTHGFLDERGALISQIDGKIKTEQKILLRRRAPRSSGGATPITPAVREGGDAARHCDAIRNPKRSGSTRYSGHADDPLDSRHGKDTPAVRPLEAAVLVHRRRRTRPDRRGVFARRAHPARRPVRGRGPNSLSGSADGAHAALTGRRLLSISTARAKFRPKGYQSKTRQDPLAS